MNFKPVNISPTPVVILDCDFRSQEGILQSFGSRKIPIIGLSADPTCPAFHSRYLTHKIVSPRLDDGFERYIEFLLNLPHRGVLIYSNDVSTVVISKYREELQSEGYLLNVPDLRTVEKVFDKLECYNLAKSVDVPVARTELVNSRNEVREIWDKFRKPVILKGTRMAGGAYKRINRLEEVDMAWEEVGRLIRSKEYQARDSRIILQEWLHYSMTDIWHCETVYSSKSEPIGFFTIKKIRGSLNDDGTYSSRIFAGEYVEAPALTEMVERLLSTVKWQGFANVDLVYISSEDKFYLTEVNPRLPGFSYYPSKAGFEMAYYYYADLTGIEYQKPNGFSRSIYFETFRFPGDLSEGIRYILKGQLHVSPFLRSYARLVNKNLVKVIEPIKWDDMGFTLHTQVRNAREFLRKTVGYLGRRMKKFLT